MSVLSEKRGRRNYIIVLSLVMLVSLSIVGISYSFWNDNLPVELTGITGNLDAEIILQPGTDAAWSLAGNTLTLNVPSTTAGTTFSAYYRIKNMGTIPIKFKASTPDPGIFTTLEPGVDWVVLDEGEESAAQYTITATAPGALGIYNSFSATIEIKQWNMP